MLRKSVKLLIDSHAVLWWLGDDPRLYKQHLGRLPPFRENLALRLQREGFESMPISLEHAIAAASLPGPHRDPWDRIMIAQALAERCHMVTVDKVFADYNVPMIW